MYEAESKGFHEGLLCNMNYGV